MKAAWCIVVLVAAFASGCAQNSTARLKGTWTGPLGAVLTITDSRWIVSEGLIEVRFDYAVVSSTADQVVVSLKTGEGISGNATCTFSDKTMRISQSTSSSVGLGGIWTRS